MPIGNFFSGLIDMSPSAVAARAVHAACNILRAEAWALAISSGCHPLEADLMGQRAYWAKRREMGQ